MAVSLVVAGDSDPDLLERLAGERYAAAGYSCAVERCRTVGRALARLVADEGLGRVWLMRAPGECAGYLVVTLGFSIKYGGRASVATAVPAAAVARGRCSAVPGPATAGCGG